MTSQRLQYRTVNNWNLWNYGACYCYNVALVLRKLKCLRNGVVHVYCKNNALEYPCIAPLMVGAAQLMNSNNFLATRLRILLQ
jgi:hypothetical protein